MKKVLKISLLLVLLYIIHISINSNKYKKNEPNIIKSTIINSNIQDKIDNEIIPIQDDDNIKRVGYYSNRSLLNQNSNGIKSIFR